MSENVTVQTVTDERRLHIFEARKRLYPVLNIFYIDNSVCHARITLSFSVVHFAHFIV